MSNIVSGASGRAPSERDSFEQDKLYVARLTSYPLIGTPIVGLVGLGIYSLTRSQFTGLAALGAGFGVIAAATAVGALLGFLFGIPRSLQGSDGETGSLGGGYRANTNLEQISDWLTKIIVGVGLVEFKQLGPPMGRLVDTISGGLGDGSTARVLAGALLLIFTAWGFLVSYIVTRVKAAGVFTEEGVAFIKRTAAAEVKTRLRPTTSDEGGASNPVTA